MGALSVDDVWPRTAEYRFRLYARRGRELNVLACSPSMAGIGTAIGQLDEDARADGGRLDDEGQVGVLDAVARRWIVNPWGKGRLTEGAPSG